MKEVRTEEKESFDGSECSGIVKLMERMESKAGRNALWQNHNFHSWQDFCFVYRSYMPCCKQSELDQYSQADYRDQRAMMVEPCTFFVRGPKTREHA